MTQVQTQNHSSGPGRFGMPAGLAGEGLRFFGVWDVNPMGECRCPAGTLWPAEGVGVPGGCRAPGKHPVPGFPRGFKDALGVEEWAGIAAAVARLGGRAAVALPGSLWVLDVDSPAGWRLFLRLVGSGAVPWSRVLAVARTRRGWHIWFRPAAGGGGGWTGKSASRAVAGAAAVVGGSGGLDVKSAGGYVVWPAGGERAWVPLEVFRREVEYGLAGWSGSPGRRRGSLRELGAVLPEEEYAAGTPTGELGRDEFAQEYRAVLALQDPGYAEQMKGESMAALSAAVSLGAPDGERNETLNTVSFLWGRDAVMHGNAVAEVSAVLVEWGLRMGLGVGEVRATVKSGLGE